MLVLLYRFSVANGLRNYYGEETHDTAKLCQNMDKCFDCLIARNQIEGIKKRKSFFQPHTDLNDEHFKWLKNDFLK